MTMDNYTFDGGRIQKMEVDYTSACDEKIPAAKGLVKANPEAFHEAVEILLNLEKQTRLGADMVSCSRVLVAICQICFEAGNWNALNEYISLLVKRRSQLKQAVSKMVQECCTYVDQTPDREAKMKLIDTLRTVTEGKIYVEVERARLTKILAEMKEKDGDVAGAATIMEELQVETYGSMEKREKVELILEQMRLCLLKEDYVRTQIIAKKIHIKFFENPEQQDLKFRFYELMILLDQDSSFLKTSRHYQAIVASSTAVPSVEKMSVDEEAGGGDATVEKKENDKDLVVERERRSIPAMPAESVKQNMIYAVLYCILSPYDNEQNDMMEHLAKNKLIEEIPAYKEILRLFMCKEIINFEIFNTEFGVKLGENKIFNESTPHGKKCWTELKHRLIEHNIRIISNYYTRISLKRMNELLDLPTDKCEEYLSKLANSGTIRVKIDRPSGIVYFSAKKAASEVLNEWAHDINSLMSLVNKTCHLINKEECINSVIAIAEK